MLVCVFHCYNESHSHIFIIMLATYGFNFPICPFGPVHLTHHTLCFTSDKVQIPRGWMNIYLLRCQNSGEIIVTSAHVSMKRSILLYFNAIDFTFYFGLWLFIEVFQNACFMISWKFCFIYWTCSAIQSSMVCNNRQ